MNDDVGEGDGDPVLVCGRQGLDGLIEGTASSSRFTRGGGEDGGKGGPWLGERGEQVDVEGGVGEEAADEASRGVFHDGRISFLDGVRWDWGRMSRV